MSGRDAQTFWISEHFVSVQGEGILAGVPSYFIRTSGCPLRCHFCDTPYASWEATGEHLSLEALLAPLVAAPKVRHTVVTGGEPLVAKGIAALVGALKAQGQHVTVETAATHYQPLPVDLWSISPKLASSAPPENSGWRERHEGLRVQDEVIRAMMGSAPYQLKFVVQSPVDLVEIEAWVARLEADPECVLLMPEGRSVEALNRVARWLVPEVIARGWRFADRLQLRLFGDTPGT